MAICLGQVSISKELTGLLVYWADCVGREWAASTGCNVSGAEGQDHCGGLNIAQHCKLGVKAVKWSPCDLHGLKNEGTLSCLKLSFSKR